MPFKMQSGIASVCTTWIDLNQFKIAAGYLKDHGVQHELIWPESVGGFPPQLSASSIQTFHQNPRYVSVSLRRNCNVCSDQDFLMNTVKISDYREYSTTNLPTSGVSG